MSLGQDAAATADVVVDDADNVAEVIIGVGDIHQKTNQEISCDEYSNTIRRSSFFLFLLLLLLMLLRYRFRMLPIFRQQQLKPLLLLLCDSKSRRLSFSWWW